jgi:hypothetical protein
MHGYYARNVLWHEYIATRVAHQAEEAVAGQQVQREEHPLRPAKMLGKPFEQQLKQTRVRERLTTSRHEGCSFLRQSTSNKLFQLLRERIELLVTCYPLYVQTFSYGVLLTMLGCRSTHEFGQCVLLAQQRTVFPTGHQIPPDGF